MAKAVQQTGARHGWPFVAAILICPLLSFQRVAAAEVEVVQFGYDNNRFSLTIEARIDASPTAVFAVITDYSSIPDLHRRIRESRVVRRIDTHTSEVFTLVKGCVVLVICKSVRRVERVVESPPNVLLATIIPEQSDFSYGWVRWRLQPSGSGTLLTYESESEPNFWVPALLRDTVLARSLSETVAEMIQRVEDTARNNQAEEGRG